MTRDLHDPRRSDTPITTMPARLGRLVGHLERDAHGRRWRGRLPISAVAPLLAAAATGRTETLVTTCASEAVRVGAVWFDAERGDVECELAPAVDARPVSPTAQGADDDAPG